MASIESIGKAPPFILDTSAPMLVNSSLMNLLKGILTAERTSWRARRQVQDRKVVGAQELAHNQACHKEQLMWAQIGR